MSHQVPGSAGRSLAGSPSERLGRLVISGLLLLPLLGGKVAEVLGFEVYYFSDPTLQAVWGTLAQTVAGWALYRMAFHHLRSGGHRRALWLCLLSTVTYGAGLYRALVHPLNGALFIASSALVTAAYLFDYRDAYQRE